MYLDKIHIVDMFYVSVDTLRSDRTSTLGFGFLIKVSR